MSFYMVQASKLQSAIILLMKTLQLSEDQKNKELKYCALYNLGLINYALGYTEEGIHNLEEAHRLVVSNNMSTYSLLQVLEALALAYINKRNFRKAFTLIQTNVGMRSLNVAEDDSIIKSIKLKSYLSFIYECINYDFSKSKKLEKLSKLDIIRNNVFDEQAESEKLIEYMMNTAEESISTQELFSESKILYY